MRNSSVATAALLLACLSAAPAWARGHGDGRIVFDNDDGPIYTIDPDGTDRVQIADHGDIATWSNGGRRIALADNAPDGRVTTALVGGDGSGYTSQVIPDPTLNLECAAWTPDDRRLACEGWDDARPDRPPGLFRVTARGWDRLRRLTTNPFGGHDIPGDYSPDGSLIAFARENPSLEAVAVFVAGAAGGRARQVTPWQDNLTNPEWSPDGRWILFDTDGTLQRVRGDGRALTPIPLSASGYAFGPGWSPDGRALVFAFYDPLTQREGIYRARADGGRAEPVTLAEDGFFSNPDWGSAPHR
jgi:Tol biopolymer transport system component